MAAQRWIVTTHVTGKPRAVEIRLYRDLNHLRGAATRHWNWTGETGSTAHMQAVCHGFIREFVNADGTTTPDPTVAMIRLSETQLSPIIVAHEVAHAAQHIYGLDYSDDRHIGEHMTAGNEEFATLLGELFGAVFAIFAAPVPDRP